MTQPGNGPDAVPNAQAMKALFARVLSEQVRSISGDPKQMRQMVYELARIKLLKQSIDEDARGSREMLQILEDAVRDVESSFDRSDAAVSPDTLPDASAADSARDPREALPTSRHADTRDFARPPQHPDRARRRIGGVNPIRQLAVAVVLAAVVGVVAYLPALRNRFIALPQRSPAMLAREAAALPESQASTPPENPRALVPEAVQTSGALPTTFGIYALSDGQLQELKPLAGKIPDRRVAISAAMTPSNTITVAKGDVKFILFRPDMAIDASGAEVRVMAKVSRSMGVDGSGKAAMVNATGSWVVRSMSFPYRAGPVDDQPRMLSLQPEKEGFTLSPGRYALVVKGIGYDFTVAGDVTDPNQCVERINATNGGFYSPCPPQH
jgi:hypothetical protein